MIKIASNGDIWFEPILGKETLVECLPGTTIRYADGAKPISAAYHLEYQLKSVFQVQECQDFQVFLAGSPLVWVRVDHHGNAFTYDVPNQTWRVIPTETPFVLACPLILALDGQGNSR
jgi:hypothetical protein